jgi:hypothetical protein
MDIWRPQRFASSSPGHQAPPASGSFPRHTQGYAYGVRGSGLGHPPSTLGGCRCQARGPLAFSQGGPAASCIAIVHVLATRPPRCRRRAYNATQLDYQVPSGDTGTHWPLRRGVCHIVVNFVLLYAYLSVPKTDTYRSSRLGRVV